MRAVALRLVIAAAAALTACGPGPSPREPVPSHRTSRPSPGGAAPRVVFPGSGPEGYENVGLERLPAVGAAGEVAVVWQRDSDGGRGYPNLELRLVDRGDTVLDRITVLTSDEWETFVTEAGPAPVFQQRLDAANAWLARLHERHVLVPMAPLQLTGQGQGDDALRELSGGGLVLRWARSQLTIEASAGTRRVLGRPAWEAGRGVTCPQCPPCEHASFLAGGYHAPGIRLLVVELAFRGTDLCWEPGNALHVVPW